MALGDGLVLIAGEGLAGIAGAGLRSKVCLAPMDATSPPGHEPLTGPPKEPTWALRGVHGPVGRAKPPSTSVMIP